MAVGGSILEGSVGVKEREKVEGSLKCPGNAKGEKPKNLDWW